MPPSGMLWAHFFPNGEDADWARFAADFQDKALRVGGSCIVERMPEEWRRAEVPVWSPLLPDFHLMARVKKAGPAPDVEPWAGALTPLVEAFPKEPAAHLPLRERLEDLLPCPTILSRRGRWRAKASRRGSYIVMTNQQHEQDLMTCVHCGLCLPACPTYLETGSEADSPRGRIVLMRGLHEGRLSPSDPDVVRHLDLCLGCRACETACPSGVPYGSILEVARARLNAAKVRPPVTDVARHAFLDTLTHPRRLALALRMADTVTDGNLPTPVTNALAGRGLLTPNAGGIRQSASPPVPPALGATPVLTAAVGPKRARVGLLTGCVMRVLYGDINADTARVLAANGCEVLVNRRQACCGALHLHNGLATDAKEMARALVDGFTPFDGLDAIVTNSAGCGSALKGYGHLLADDPAYANRAAAFAAKIRDISEFLDDLGWVAPLQPVSEQPVTIAYHDACHLAHGQGIREQPRALLARIPGVALVPLPESEICCGSAGIYNFTEPDMAQKLQLRKLDHVVKTGASIVAAANPGCLAWIEAGAKARGLNIRLAHPVSLLAEALHGEGWTEGHRAINGEAQ